MDVSWMFHGCFMDVSWMFHGFPPMIQLISLEETFGYICNTGQIEVLEKLLHLDPGKLPN